MNGFTLAWVPPLPLAVAYCGLALQDQAHEFGLAPRAGLVEHVSEVCPCCRQRDAEAAGSGSQPIAFQYLAGEGGFRPSQPEVLAEAFAMNDCSLLRIADEQDRSRPDDIDPAPPSSSLGSAQLAMVWRSSRVSAGVSARKPSRPRTRPLPARSILSAALLAKITRAPASTSRTP